MSSQKDTPEFNHFQLCPINSPVLSPGDNTVTPCGKHCKRRCTKQASLIWTYTTPLTTGCTCNVELIQLGPLFRSRHFVVQINRYFKVTNLLELYLGGKFSEHRWKAEIYRAFNSFCVTDSLTHLHIHARSQTHKVFFVVCPVPLMHWADNYQLNLRTSLFM